MTLYCVYTISLDYTLLGLPLTPVPFTVYICASRVRYLSSMLHVWWKGFNVWIWFTSQLYTHRIHMFLCNAGWKSHPVCWWLHDNIEISSVHNRILWVAKLENIISHKNIRSRMFIYCGRLYHHEKLHANRCHCRQCICPWIKKNIHTPDSISDKTRDVKLELFRNRSLNFHNRLLTDDRIDGRQSWHTIR